MGKKLVEWGRSDDSRCPNCNCLGEDAEHLMVCRSAGRSGMFEEHVLKIEEWMETHYTDPELSILVLNYLHGRGRQKLTQLAKRCRRFQGLAQAQDRIGWRHFTEGKLAKQFRKIQQCFLLHEDT